MKKTNQIIWATGLLFLINLSLFGQTYLLLDETFKAASTPMVAKRKGFSTVGRFEFGPYKIVSGKEGWTTTKGKTGFFSGDTRTESKANISFVFTGPTNDTITSNITFTSVTQIDQRFGFVFRTLTNWSNQVITENYEVYMGSYQSSADTSIWNLVLAYPVGEEITGKIQDYMISMFKGVLGNSQTTIDIIPEFRWENGKQATILKPLEGYLFNFQGETVAAVQSFPTTKTFVWIKQDLPDNLKFILAAGAATMLVRSSR